MFIDRFCETEYDSYESFKKNFKINVPENFNFGYDVVDELAKILDVLGLKLTLQK